MFYSHDILQKRGGKFGIVWVVATRQPELTRREYMSVRVRKTCEDIMDYLFLRMPGRTTQSARPRFSLYLSAQLMYGTIKVFSKQNKYLYDDMAHLLCNLRSSVLMAPIQDIDLKFDSTKQNLPEPVGRADPFSADFDLQFGKWTFPLEEELTVLEQEMMRELSLTLSPSVQLELSPTIPQTHQEMIAEALKAPHTVSSPEEIQLKEDIFLATDQIQIPGEKELPTFDGKEIAIVSEKELEEIPITLEDLMSPRKTRSRSTSSVSDVLPFTEDVSLRLPPVLETPVAEKKDEQVMERPATPQRLPKTPGVTPIQPEDARPKRRRVRPSLPMELDPVSPSPRRRRKRRLQFIDVETQITKKQLKNNMVTGRDTCMPYILPPTRPSTAEELFARPGHKNLTHPELLRLWTRNAVTKSNGWTEEEERDPSWATSERLEYERRLAEVQAEKTAEKVHMELRSPPPDAVQSSDSDKSSRTRRSKRLAQQPVEALQKSVLDQPVEEQSIEVARGDSALSLEGSRLKDTSVEIERSHQSLEQSREKILDDSIISRPRSRRGSDQISSEEEIQIDLAPVHPGISGIQPLETLHEELEVFPAPVLPPVDLSIHSPSTASNYQEEMMRHIESKTATKTWTRFHSICGTNNTYRSYAAKMFTALLDLCALQITSARQKETFADIYIRRGPNW